MKADAYLFAREVDCRIEALDPADYHRRGRDSKRLQEELYPLSRLALHFKQPGLEVKVVAFEHSGRPDGRIIVTGFNPREFDVEVTSVYSYAEALRAELLASQGSAPGAGPIRKDRRTGSVIATMEAVDVGEHFRRIAKGTTECYRAKLEKSYDPGTILLITFDEIKLSGRYAWDRLFEASEEEGGFRGGAFAAVYLFNSATNELRHAA